MITVSGTQKPLHSDLRALIGNENGVNAEGCTDAGTNWKRYGQSVARKRVMSLQCRVAAIVMLLCAGAVVLPEEISAQEIDFGLPGWWRKKRKRATI
jgi:hypothetical protein